MIRNGLIKVMKKDALRILYTSVSRNFSFKPFKVKVSTYNNHTSSLIEINLLLCRLTFNTIAQFSDEFGADRTPIAG